jgi:putative SOS response-associated peptidase YedK
MVEEDHRSYLRLIRGYIDFEQFYEMFVRRRLDRGIRFPRGMDRNFDNPKSDIERDIKALIDEYRASEATKLETEIFTQKKRLADAERKLAEKETKGALNDRRIATDKISKALGKLPLLKGTQPHEADGRIFPLSCAPIVIHEGDRNVVKLARYGVDHENKGLYNARRDNLGRYWGREFAHTHAVMIAYEFFENVDRGGQNAVLHFVPMPAGPMYIACLYAETADPMTGKKLLSFAAITDDPPPEVLAAGHDRMIINMKPENVERWLTPQGLSVDELQAILSDRQKPYYEHEVMAA